MKLRGLFVGVGVELGILAVLGWRYVASVDDPLGGPSRHVVWLFLLPLVLYVPLAFVQWGSLRQLCIERTVRMRCCLSTGACIFMSLFLIADFGSRLSSLAWLQRNNGSRPLTGTETGRLKDGTVLYSVERMRIEMLLCGCLTASMCLVYGSLCSKTTAISSTPPTHP